LFSKIKNAEGLEGATDDDDESIDELTGVKVSLMDNLELDNDDDFPDDMGFEDIDSAANEEHARVEDYLSPRGDDNRLVVSRGGSIKKRKHIGGSAKKKISTGGSIKKNKFKRNKSFKKR
jgi:hypothetical protein